MGRSACTDNSVEQRLPMLFHWDAMNGHKQSRARSDSRQRRIASISEDFLFDYNGCKFVANTSVSNGNDVAHPFLSQSVQELDCDIARISSIKTRTLKIDNS